MRCLSGQKSPCRPEKNGRKTNEWTHIRISGRSGIRIKRQVITLFP